MRMRWCLLLLAALPPAVGAQSWVGDPIVGYFRDTRSGAIRPILGFLGASYLGAPVPWDAGLRVMALSSEARYALCIRDADQQWLVAGFGRRAGISQTLAVSGTDARLSPRGTAAWIYDSASGHGQVIAGLPSAPVALPAVDLPPDAATVAVGDDGSLLFATGSAVWLETPDGNSWTVAALDQVATLAFLRQSSDVIAAGPGGVWWIRGAADNPQVIPIAGPADGIAAPLALGVSADNQRVFVADASANAIFSVDLTANRWRDPIVSNCRCAVTGLERLARISHSEVDLGDERYAAGATGENGGKSMYTSATCIAQKRFRAALGPKTR